ncbi:hypothetical protein NDU88_002267 [Pleurodeles waltl]|uniref:Uncharacterized protein n=1 Tax=Pleurodeles waltl TaxID=8319 RepID=A0AAV7WN55_PLEWA|nr:hypothetical protein NDU88_002267 [Pleurodeles waltl]
MVQAWLPTVAITKARRCTLPLTYHFHFYYRHTPRLLLIFNYQTLPGVSTVTTPPSQRSLRDQLGYCYQTSLFVSAVTTPLSQRSLRDRLGYRYTCFPTALLLLLSVSLSHLPRSRHFSTKLPHVSAANVPHLIDRHFLKLRFYYKLVIRSYGSIFLTLVIATVGSHACTITCHTLRYFVYH